MFFIKKARIIYCMSCHKVIVLITGRAHCFQDDMYIMPIFVSWITCDQLHLNGKYEITSCKGDNILNKRTEILVASRHRNEYFKKTKNRRDKSTP